MRLAAQDAAVSDLWAYFALMKGVGTPIDGDGASSTIVGVSGIVMLGLDPLRMLVLDGVVSHA